MTTPDQPAPPAAGTSRPEPKPPTPEQTRIRALERENRRLRDQLHMLEQTLRLIAPETFVSEEQLEEEMAHAVPAAQVLAELSHNLNQEARDAA